MLFYSSLLKIKPIESIPAKAKNHKTAKYTKIQDLGNNLPKVYNKIYAQKKDTSQFIISEGLSRGQGVGAVKSGRAKGNLPEDIRGFVPRISRFKKELMASIWKLGKLIRSYDLGLWESLI